MLAPEQAAARLRALADRVRSLKESRRDPEAFHVERDQLYVGMTELADELAGKPDYARERGERGAFRTGTIAHKGRLVPAVTRGGAKRTPLKTEIEKVFG